MRSFLLLTLLGALLAGCAEPAPSQPSLHAVPAGDDAPRETEASNGAPAAPSASPQAPEAQAPPEPASPRAWGFDYHAGLQVPAKCADLSDGCSLVASDVSWTSMHVAAPEGGAWTLRASWTPGSSTATEIVVQIVRVADGGVAASARGAAPSIEAEIPALPPAEYALQVSPVAPGVFVEQDVHVDLVWTP